MRSHLFRFSPVMGLLILAPVVMASLFYNRNQNEVYRPNNPLDRNGEAFRGADGADANGDGVADFTVTVQPLSRTEIRVTVGGSTATLSNLALALDGDPANFVPFAATTTLASASALAFGDHEVRVKARTRTGRVSAVVTNRFTLENALYVSPQGLDSQAGLAMTPLLTLQTALDRLVAQGGRTLYVAAGTYTRGAGLSYDSAGGLRITTPDVGILGGYDSGFTQVVGHSVLDGGNAFRVVDVANATNVLLSRLDITGGQDRGSGGGGLRITGSRFIRVTNLLIHHNTALRGGGLAISESTNITISATIDHNTGTTTDPSFGGGGVYMLKALQVAFLADSRIFANTATFGGGLSCHTGTSNLVLAAAVFGNTATERGGGLHLVNTRDVSVTGNHYANYAATLGAGICGYSNVSSLTVDGTLYGNDLTGSDTTNRRGAGLYFSGDTLSVRGEVYENSGAAMGSGLALEGVTGFTVTAAVNRNTATTGFSNRGGGVYLSNCAGGLISGAVSNNKGNTGGGIYAVASTALTNSGAVNFNTADTRGGGLVFEACSASAISGRIFSNEADIGAGAFLRFSTNIDVSGHVSSNKAKERTGGLVVDHSVNTQVRGTLIENLVAGAGNTEAGVALWVVNSNSAETTTVNGAFLTNNRVGAGGSVIALSVSWPSPGLVLSSNIIGGNNLNSLNYGISELLSLSNHVLVGNTFVTNRLGFLYSNYSGSVVSNHEWSVLNGPSIRHDAGNAQGNGVTAF